MTLLLILVSGVWGASTTLPTTGTYTNATTKYSLTNSTSIVVDNTIFFAARSTISLSSDYGMRPYTTGFYFEVTAAATVTFNVKSTTTSSRTITGQVYIAKDELSYVWKNTTLDPAQTLENYVIAVNSKSSDLTDEETAIKANNTLKGITGNKDANKKVLIGETFDSNIHTKSGDAISHSCPTTSGGTNSFNVSLPSAGKYLIYLTSTGGSVGITSIDIEATDTRTNVSLSFPNDTEDATLGESFSAPTLTVDPVAASTAVAYSSSNTSVAEVNSSTGAITLKASGSTVITAAISDDATYKDASASYTLVVTDPNAPTLTASPTDLTLSASANITSPSATFTVTGTNLTDGNYNISVPSVDGLSVSPANITVSGGSVNQEVTVTYAPSADAASSSDDITLTIDEIVATVTVNYSATLSVYTQETISDVTTWDFVNDIDHDADGNADVQPSSATSATLYANTSGIVFKNTFPKSSLTWATTAKNLYAYRKANKCSQGAVLSFKTSAPGKVTVLFAHNGSGSQYVKVNSQTGEIESTDGGGSGTTAKEESFQVEAGTVTITGSDATKIRIFRIKFQPTVPVTISAAKYSTFASSQDLDFSGADGLYAYTATIAGSTITFNKVNKAKAGEGLLLYADVDANTTYYVPVATDSPNAVDGNKLVPGTGLAVPSNGEGETKNYVLSNNGGEVNFYLANDKVVGTNKAYLKNVDPSAAAKMYLPTEEETDGIAATESQRTRQATAFNLAGQKVGAEYKGIVIVNGKKYVRK